MWNKEGIPVTKITKDYVGDNTNQMNTYSKYSHNLKASILMFVFFLMTCVAAFLFQSTINVAVVQMSHTTMKCVKVEIYKDGHYQEGSCEDIPKKHEIIWVK